VVSWIQYWSPTSSWRSLQTSLVARNDPDQRDGRKQDLCSMALVCVRIVGTWVFLLGLQPLSARDFLGFTAFDLWAGPCLWIAPTHVRAACAGAGWGATLALAGGPARRGLLT